MVLQHVRLFQREMEELYLRQIHEVPTSTSLAVDNLGKLSLSNGGEPTLTEAGPLDAALDNGSKYLYVLSGGNDAIVSYALETDGVLTQIDSDAGLPDRASGLVVGR